MSNKWRSKSKTSSKGFEMSDKSYPLGKNRFVSISDFKNQTRIDIREYYSDDSGDLKPGRKGISLSMEEWNTLKTIIPKIDNKIKGVDDSDNDSHEEPKESKKSKSKKYVSESSDESDDKSYNKSPKKAKKSKSDSEESEEDSDPKRKKSTKKVDSDSD